MIRVLLRLALFTAAVAGLAFWAVTRPATLPADTALPAGDPVNGALVFAAAGCASCHAEPGSGSPDAPVLSGGRAFKTDFGTFYAPNISPDPDAGIGSWTEVDFARALTKGVSPDGQHYYPAFPYTAYAFMTPQDTGDLLAYMRTLPASPTVSQPHDLGFPFSIRRGLGVWKVLNQSADYHLQGELSEQEVRGRYIAEGLAHCSECHTERDALGGLNRSRWMAGAPSPTGKGRIPNITPGVLGWSEADLTAYFTSGLTPEYDSAGGDMAVVIENLAKLPEADRAALAAYMLRIETVR
ncbi:c-type cytochrome [uncultured Roseobacter sp.]|uniref:c-type cytochrome n=1 Tax=uncultured Roseobacter sp. TaxID=114847 RepID=UPI002631B09F|nr:c-type cytochrome [uncultured Roseobacter sp.]